MIDYIKNIMYYVFNIYIIYEDIINYNLIFVKIFTFI